MTGIPQPPSPNIKNDPFYGNAYNGPLIEMVSIPLFLLFLSVVFGFPGCFDSAHKEPPSPIVATINQNAITLEEFNQYLKQQHLDPNTYQDTPLSDELLITLLDELIERRLILQEAHRQELSSSEREIDEAIDLIRADYSDQDFESFLQEEGLTLASLKEQMREDLIIKKVLLLNIDGKITVSPEEIKAYYDQNKKDFVAPEQVRASQIVVAREEEAKEIRKALMQGTDFENLAIEKSLSPDSQQGGDLGFFKKGDMPEEFDVVFSLKKSAISPIVQTPYGYHLFKVVQKVSSRTLAFSEVESQIYDILFQEKREHFYKQWISDLKSARSIKINLAVLNPEP